MLGKEVNMPACLMFPQAATKCGDVDDYVANLTSNIQEPIMGKVGSYVHHGKVLQ